MDIYSPLYQGIGTVLFLAIIIVSILNYRAATKEQNDQTVFKMQDHAPVNQSIHIKPCAHIFPKLKS